MNSIEKQMKELGDEIDELIYCMSGSGSESYLEQLKHLYVSKVQRYNKLKEQLQKQIDTIDNYKRAMHGI